MSPALPGFSFKINATKEEALKQLAAAQLPDDKQQEAVLALLKMQIEQAPAGAHFEITAGGHMGEDEGASTVRFMYKKA